MKSEIKIKNDREFRRKITRLRRQDERKLNKILSRNTDRMHARATALAPHGKSGGPHLDQQIKITRLGVVTSKADYSLFVEKGTDAHTIRIKRKKVLAGPKRAAPSGWNNFSQDWAIYGRKIRHPGTEAQPFMKPAWEYARRRFRHDIEKMFR